MKLLKVVGRGAPATVDGLAGRDWPINWGSTRGLSPGATREGANLGRREVESVGALGGERAWCCGMRVVVVGEGLLDRDDEIGAVPKDEDVNDDNEEDQDDDDEIEGAEGRKGVVRVVGERDADGGGGSGIVGLGTKGEAEVKRGGAGEGWVFIVCCCGGGGADAVAEGEGEGKSGG